MKIEKTTSVTLWDVRSSANETIASIATKRWSDGVYLFRFYVVPECREKGYGTKLLLGVLKKLKRRKVYLDPCPFAGTPMSETQLRNWYEKLGFVRTGNGLLVLNPKETNE